MRLSIFAMPAPSRTSAQPKAPDGRLLRSRFELADSGFDVADVDPQKDLAEQLETLLRARKPTARDHVMLYAGCQALLSIEEELFLCLDPSAPTVGDAVADIAAVLREQAEGAKLIVLDLVDTKAALDKPRVEAFIRAAERAVDTANSGIELVLAVRPRSAADTAPFVEAVLGAVDALPAGRGLTTRGIFERIEKKLSDALPVLHHARTKMAFELVPLRVGKRDSAASMPRVPPPAPVPDLAPIPTTPRAGEVVPIEAQEPAKAAPAEAQPKTATEPPPAKKPAGLASFRPPPTDAVDLGWGSDDDFAAPAPAIAPIRTFAAPPGASLPPPPGPASTRMGTDGPVSGPRSGPISARSISPFARHTIEGELLYSQGENDAAIAAFRRALAVLGPGGDPDSRAEMYARIGEIRMSRGENEDAISDFEKALALRPGHIPALESLLLLCAAEQDWRGVMSAEERLLAALPSDTMRFERLIEFAARWEKAAHKPQRARVLFERANELRPHDPIVTTQIRRLSGRSIPPPKA